MEEKRSNRPGTYVLRESETKYNVFYLDFCGKDSKPRTHRIEQFGPDDFVLLDSVQRYRSLGLLIASHQDPEGQVYLAECLPPSEYGLLRSLSLDFDHDDKLVINKYYFSHPLDKSPLLICAAEGVGSDVAADEEIIAALLEGGPRCIPPHQLQVYKAQPLPKSSDNGEPRTATNTTLYRAMWRVAKGKKLEAAIKVLKEEESRFTREFLELAGKWGQLRSGALVRLYGLTVAPAVGMLLELVKLGPLDVYLRENSPQTVKTVDMVEAAACLATALWHLVTYQMCYIYIFPITDAYYATFSSGQVSNLCTDLTGGKWRRPWEHKMPKTTGSRSHGQ